MSNKVKLPRALAEKAYRELTGARGNGPSGGTCAATHAHLGGDHHLLGRGYGLG